MLVSSSYDNTINIYLLDELDDYEWYIMLFYKSFIKV